ncbi:MAG: 2-C-methyl-D-erythritol 2,4-cyclodiphosphate synthase [Clostridia bacterium]|nr:2-C-methyl-D-erythritol 2,4-cyclodiphosphate synthase [Clostridia bacterium]
MKNGKRIGCVVVAAGRGARAGFEYNKLFHKMNGKSVLTHTLNALTSSGVIDEIALVLSESDLDAYEKIKRTDGVCPLVNAVALGGSTRQESVYSGLRALSKNTDIALIHDGARPFVTNEIIENVISDAMHFGSGVISTRVIDTIKRVDGEDFAVETPVRDTLRAVQTPQAFSYGEIMRAHEHALKNHYNATDDAALYEFLFGRVKLTEAESAMENKKLTLKSDFEDDMPKFLFRNGTGYDVHRLVEGRKLILCGEEIPYEKGLLGHSDADVALHALMDAMLGACAMGDIGKLFPDNDMSFKDISSMLLLKRANEKIIENGFTVTSCDITIVCQKPKLSPFIRRMSEKIASVLSLSVDRVSVKATTTEKLGFEGEGLGISAQAAATVIQKI